MRSETIPGGWRRSLPASLSFVVAVALLGVGVAMASPRESVLDHSVPSQDAAAIFQTSCSACHTIGGGNLVGPDLEGVTTRRERDWLLTWIADPTAVLAAGDPIATQLLAEFNNVPMPTLGLAAADVEALVAYFEELDGGAAPPQPTLISQPGAGDANAGRNLFTGASTLANGGPSCRACHSIAGIGSLGGGKVGPDLTTSYQRLGDAMITWPQTGTMLPVFSQRALTESEQADLLAFFQSTDVTARPVAVIWQLTGLAAAGVVIFAVLAQLIWRRRLSGVRRPMVAGRK